MNNTERAQLEQWFDALYGVAVARGLCDGKEKEADTIRTLLAQDAPASKQTGDVCLQVAEDVNELADAKTDEAVDIIETALKACRMGPGWTMTNDMINKALALLPSLRTPSRIAGADVAQEPVAWQIIDNGKIMGTFEGEDTANTELKNWRQAHCFIRPLYAAPAQPSEVRPAPENAVGLSRQDAEKVHDALAGCYDVTEWPADGSTACDYAIGILDRALTSTEAKADDGMVMVPRFEDYYGTIEKAKLLHGEMAGHEAATKGTGDE